jgi:hypothetical protein
VADLQEVQNEQRRMILLRQCVDWTTLRLRYDTLTREETVRLIEETRQCVLMLCPGKGDVFDLVLRPRFLRIASERCLAEWGLTDAVN